MNHVNPGTTIVTPAPPVLGEAKYHLDIDIFMRALQDTGTQQANSQAKLIKYTKIDGLSKKLIKHWRLEGFPNMPSNSTRGAAAIATLLIRLRKHVDTTQVDVALHKYAKDEKVFIIVNDKDTAGFNLIVTTMRNYWASSHYKAKDSRTLADAIRAAACMLVQEKRGSVSRFLSNKLTRDMLDQAMDPMTVLFGELLNGGERTRKS
jgi:hypothetical protein